MLGHRVAFGAMLLTGLQMLSKFISLVSLVILARLLTPADFGLVALAASVLAIVGAATELNVSDALIQRDEIDPRDIDTAFTINLARGMLTMLVVLTSAYPMAIFYGDNRLIGVLCALSLFSLMSGLSSPRMVYFLRRLEYGPGARVQLISQLGGFVAAVTIGFATKSYWALIVSQITAQAISTAYSYYLAPYRPRFRLAGARQILHFAGWMTTSRIISTLNLQSDRFMIGHVLGKARLGQYTVGSDMSSMATYAFAGPLMATMFGGFSRLQGDIDRMRAAFLKGQQMLVIVLLPFGFGASVIADRLLPLVLGPNWDGAIAAVIWMAPVVSLQVLYMPLLSIAMAMGRPRVLVVRETVNLAMRLPLTLIGAWYYGLMGAIIVRTFSGLAIILMTLMMANRFIQISVGRQISNIWRSLTSVLMMAGSVELLKLLIPRPDGTALRIADVAMLITVGASVYASTHIALWLAAGRPDGAEKFMLSMIRNRSRRYAAGGEVAP